jgi:hypothetical protein
MRIFEVADEQVFFENTTLIATGQMLGFLPDRMEMAAVTLQPEGFYLAETSRGKLTDHYLACLNYTQNNVCNWMVRADDPEGNGYCLACRLNGIIPNLAEDPQNIGRWAKLEAAKRRLVYTLLRLGLPVRSGLIEPATGLSFQFLADAPVAPTVDPSQPAPAPAVRVLTGHENGIITLNIEEADDEIRERTRTAMGEKYRTLLGHFRHESGHYYWDHIVDGTPVLEKCRQVFGDDTQDYGVALQQHYSAGPPADWQNNFITAYAASHPWEDWAESWAHYLYVVDAVELAQQQGLVRGLMDISGAQRITFRTSFGGILEAWADLTILLNSFNRTAGISDPYPFVLSKPAMEKMEFVHEAVLAAAGGN